MHEMQTIVTDERGVCPSVCLSRSLNRLHCTTTAELIQILFGVQTSWGPKEHFVRRGFLIPHSELELGEIGPIVDLLYMHISGMAQRI